MSQITTTKKIIAITTISLGSVGFANAQLQATPTAQSSFGERIMQNLTGSQTKHLGKGKHGKGGHKHENKEAIHEAIATGNFSEFQKLASTTPMGKIDQTTFNSLTPHFLAMKNAKTNIESILKAAGVEKPQKTR